MFFFYVIELTYTNNALIENAMNECFELMNNASTAQIGKEEIKKFYSEELNESSIISKLEKKSEDRFSETFEAEIDSGRRLKQ